jgi:hypothetical protein
VAGMLVAAVSRAGRRSPPRRGAAIATPSGEAPMARYDRYLPPRGGEYAGDFRPRTGMGGGGGEWGRGTLPEPRDAWDGPVYGPARYGLGPYHERLRRRRRPDAELKAEVEEALFLDTWVDADAITVEVEDGVVTLSGELPDFEEVRFATDDAWDVVGVRGVRQELTVDPSRRPPLDGVPRGGGDGRG